jgi:hypothetical protein
MTAAWIIVIFVPHFNKIYFEMFRSFSVIQINVEKNYVICLWNNFLLNSSFREEMNGEDVTSHYFLSVLTF